MATHSVDGYYIFSTSAAALLARIITHPMDTLKTRLQIMNIPINTALFHKIVFPHPQQPKLASLLGLYKGLPITLLFSIPAFSVYLSCYETSKELLHSHTASIKRDSVPNHLISGCLAEVTAGILFTPMEVMKNRLQTSQRIYAGSIAKHILAAEGIKGFFKGYWMGLVVFIPHSMTYFVTYEKLKKWLTVQDDKQESPFKMYMLCSSIAATLGIILSTPLDIIKTRWQISAAEHGQQYRHGPISIARRMMKEGKGAFTRGLGARIAWGIPTTAISMTMFEVLKDKRDSIGLF
ncbi:mitochondrial carrier domain-containing protein [Pilobolus umbonatus]|nr:mitochondrial carrier domain-containing protein [Pilobolus umbonatus]